MKGFNSPLTSKKQLENMDYEQFEELKYTIKCFKSFAKIMTEDKPSTVKQ